MLTALPPSSAAAAVARARGGGEEVIGMSAHSISSFSFPSGLARSAQKTQEGGGGGGRPPKMEAGGEEGAEGGGGVAVSTGGRCTRAGGGRPADTGAYDRAGTEGGGRGRREWGGAPIAGGRRRRRRAVVGRPEKGGGNARTPTRSLLCTHGFFGFCGEKPLPLSLPPLPFLLLHARRSADPERGRRGRGLLDLSTHCLFRPERERGISRVLPPSFPSFFACNDLKERSKRHTDTGASLYSFLSVSTLQWFFSSIFLVGKKFFSVFE